VNADPARRTFRLVWLNNCVTAIGMMGFLPLFPLLLRDLGLRDDDAVKAWSGVLVGAAPLTAAFMGPVWGVVGDRIGRKPMMVRANLAITLFVGLMAFARTPEQLLALRLAQGVFSGFIAPSITLVSVTTPLHRQGHVTGLLATAVVAGSLVGPTLGGLVADHAGFAAVFAGCAALSALAAALVAWGVREERPAAAGAPLTAGGVLAALRRDLAVFLQPGPLRTVIVVVFVTRFGMRLVDPVLALWVEQLGGTPPERLGTVTGSLFSATALATLACTPLWGRFGDRRGHGRVLAACAGVGAAGYLAQGLVDSVAPLWPLRFVSGAFLAGCQPAAFALAAQASAEERRGAVLGMAFGSQVFANAAGPAAGGALATLLGLRGLFVLAAALMGAAALVAIAHSRREARAAG
jgi:DHA1 family multidrug resistance protein-like MFS transporter